MAAYFKILISVSCVISLASGNENFQNHSSSSTPVSYCSKPVNQSNCGVPRKQVFFYEPGSRCKTTYWNGCPTENIFPDKRTCIFFCIGKVYSKDGIIVDRRKLEHRQGWAQYNYFASRLLPGRNRELDNNIIPDDDLDVPKKCLEEFNDNQCNEEATEAFTYDRIARKCVKKRWYGCPSENSFKDEHVCSLECGRKRQESVDLKDSLNHLPKNTVVDIDDALNDILNNKNTKDGDENDIKVDKAHRDDNGNEDDEDSNIFPENNSDDIKPTDHNSKNNNNVKDENDNDTDQKDDKDESESMKKLSKVIDPAEFLKVREHVQTTNDDNSNKETNADSEEKKGENDNNDSGEDINDLTTPKNYAKVTKAAKKTYPVNTEVNIVSGVKPKDRSPNVQKALNMKKKKAVEKFNRK